jgi:hypothetical protein
MCPPLRGAGNGPIGSCKPATPEALAPLGLWWWMGCQPSLRCPQALSQQSTSLLCSPERTLLMQASAPGISIPLQAWTSGCERLPSTQYACKAAACLVFGLKTRRALSCNHRRCQIASHSDDGGVQAVDTAVRPQHQLHAWAEHQWRVPTHVLQGLHLVLGRVRSRHGAGEHRALAG